jgi:hypothetical protein
MSLVGSENGEATLLWTTLEPTFWSSRFANGQWEEPISFGTEPLMFVRVVVSKTGDVAALGSIDETTLAVRRLLSGSDEWVEEILTEGLFNSSLFDLAVDGTGNLTAVWIEDDNAVPSVWASRFDVDAREWSEPFLLENDTVPVNRPVVVSNDAGQTMVVWWRSGENGVIGFNRLW